MSLHEKIGGSSVKDYVGNVMSKVVTVSPVYSMIILEPVIIEPGFSVPRSKNVGRAGRVNFLEMFMLESDIFLQLQRYTMHRHSFINFETNRLYSTQLV